MKNAIGLLIALAVFAFVSALSSCAACPLTTEIPTFESIDDVELWVRGNVSYEMDPLGGLWDSWQTHDETLARGKGDCEDISLLWLFLVYNSFGEKGELVISKIPGSKFHASAVAAGYRFYTRADQQELFTLIYDEAMATARAKSLQGGDL